jgi:hypothetical protein
VDSLIFRDESSDLLIQIEDEKKISPPKKKAFDFEENRMSMSASVSNFGGRSVFSNSTFRPDRERTAQRRIDPNEEFFKMLILSY